MHSVRLKLKKMRYCDSDKRRSQDIETTSSSACVVYLDMSVDEVLASAAVLPLSAGDLVHLWRLPDWVDALRVVPQKHEAVTFHRRI